MKQLELKSRQQNRHKQVTWFEACQSVSDMVCKINQFIRVSQLPYELNHRFSQRTSSGGARDPSYSDSTHIHNRIRVSISYIKYIKYINIHSFIS